MAAANTVEATLASKYVDGISKGIDRTEQIVRQQMGAMLQSSAGFASSMSSAFESAVSKVRALAAIAWNISFSFTAGTPWS